MADFSYTAAFLFVSGWCLITLTLSDVFINARQMCCGKRKGAASSQLYSYSSGCRIVKVCLHITGSHKIKPLFLWMSVVLIPFAQYILWNSALITGFAFLYLALDWKNGSQINAASEVFSAFSQSFSISARFSPNVFNPNNPGVLLLAHIQFYLGYVFYGFIFIYILILRDRIKRLQPFLYRLRDEIKSPYSPLDLAARLRRSYGAAELLFILKDWEIWTNKLTNDLRANPSLIFSRSYADEWSWLSSLNLILDASAALIVTSEGSVKRQAVQTLKAARNALFETGAFFSFLPDETVRTNFETNRKCDYDDVLLSEVVFDSAEDAKREEERLSVWRSTYLPSVKTAANRIDVKIPR